MGEREKEVGGQATMFAHLIYVQDAGGVTDADLGRDLEAAKNGHGGLEEQERTHRNIIH